MCFAQFTRAGSYYVLTETVTLGFRIAKRLRTAGLPLRRLSQMDAVPPQARPPGRRPWAAGVLVGTLRILGPRSATMSCTPGLPCTVSVDGVGLARHNSLVRAGEGVAP